MKLKGDWDSGTNYDVGDVVRYTNGNVYHLQKPCKAGVPPVDTTYWGLANQLTQEAVCLILDALDIESAKNETIASNLSENALILKSSTENSTKEFIITVDDEGEITATEVETEEESDT